MANIHRFGIQNTETDLFFSGVSKNGVVSWSKNATRFETFEQANAQAMLLTMFGDKVATIRIVKEKSYGI